MMTSKERLLTALSNKTPDHLPATTHHVFDAWLEDYMNGVTRDEFFKETKLDGIRWTNPVIPSTDKGEWFLDNTIPPDFLEIKKIVSPEWNIIEEQKINEKGILKHFTIVTPSGNLTA